MGKEINYKLDVLIIYTHYPIPTKGCIQCTKLPVLHFLGEVIGRQLCTHIFLKRLIPKLEPATYCFGWDLGRHLPSHQGPTSNHYPHQIYIVLFPTLQTYEPKTQAAFGWRWNRNDRKERKERMEIFWWNPRVFSPGPPKIDLSKMERKQGWKTSPIVL